MTPQQETWLALGLVDRLGAKTLRVLLERFGSVDALSAAPPAELVRRGGVAPALAERIAACRTGTALRIESRLVDEHGVRLLTLDGEGYPEALRALPNAPALIYARGQVPLPTGPTLAVVGTRRPTRSGEKAARLFVERLAAQVPDLVVVSGLARGIDTLAHEAALAAGRATVAVLANGLASVYPPENTELAARIASQGTVLSEFKMTQNPLARHFPIRNRLLAGLARAILVVEAPERSGTLITAGFGLNYSKAVFALPGSVDQESYRGTNRWIQRNLASLALDPEDLLPALTGTPRTEPTQMDWLAPRSAQPAAPVPEGERGAIQQALRAGPLHPDDLAALVGLPVEKLLGLLLEMELAGELVQTRDLHYELA